MDLFNKSSIVIVFIIVNTTISTTVIVKFSLLLSPIIISAEQHYPQYCTFMFHKHLIEQNISQNLTLSLL